jgi:hypothetical protein
LDPRERAREVGDALPGELLELVFVDIVLLGVTTTEKQRSRANVLTLGLVGSALLQETSEGSEAGTSRDHDHGGRGILTTACGAGGSGAVERSVRGRTLMRKSAGLIVRVCLSLSS